MTQKRWDTDERHIGAGHARPQVGELQRLQRAMEQDGWVAEDPHLHLLPHIRAAVDTAPAVWHLISTSDEGNRYVVQLEWLRRDGTGRAQLRQDVFALIGSIAESHTHVVERVVDGTIDFVVTTGMLDGDGPFAAHGHVVCLRITERSPS